MDVPTDDYVPGDPLTLPAVTAASSGTGSFSWQLDVLPPTFDDDSSVTETTTGTLGLVDRTRPARTAAAGASTASTKLVPTSDGVVWVSGNGDARLFSGVEPDVYGSPVGDFGSLVGNDDGSFTYTAKGGNVEQVRRRRLRDQPDLSHRPGLDLHLHHGPGGAGHDPGPRRRRKSAPSPTTPTPACSAASRSRARTFLTFSDTGTDLTGIVDVDGSTRTLGYSSHLLTADNWAPWATTFGYDTTGRVDAVDLGGVQPYTVSAADAGGVATITDNCGNTTLLHPGFPGPSAGRAGTGECGADVGLRQQWPGGVRPPTLGTRRPTYEYAYGPYDTPRCTAAATAT